MASSRPYTFDDMLDRDACERRVYRLATLLTGDPQAASRVIEAVVGAQPDLRRPDSARLDRLTVLRSREITPAALADGVVTQDIAAAVASLDAQGREAWVLARVYKTPLRETARAMDCSVTATRRHLERAEAALSGRLGDDAEAAPGVVLDYSMSLDVPAFYHEARERRLRRRRLVRTLAVVLVVLALIVAGSWCARDRSPQGAAVPAEVAR